MTAGFDGRRVLVGVGGSVAAFKACEVVTDLRRERRRGPSGDDRGGDTLRDAHAAARTERQPGRLEHVGGRWRRARVTA